MARAVPSEPPRGFRVSARLHTLATMPRPQRLRVQACLLLLALVGGGVGLPIVDALVFHGRTPAVHGERNLGDDGSPSKNHTQLCIIAKAVQAKMVLPAAKPTIHALAESAGTPARSVATLLRSNSRHSPALPRAPPHYQA